MSNGDDAGSSGENPFERRVFDVERVADNPVEAFDSIETDTVDDPSTSARFEDVDIDPGLRRLFLKLALLYKTSIIGVTLGALFLVFEKGPAVGPELLAGSLCLLVYTLHLTRRGKERIDTGEFHDGDSRGGEQ